MSLVSEAPLPASFEPFARRALLAASRDLSNLRDQEDCAELAAALGHADAARLLYGVIFLRGGFSPEATARQVVVARRTGLWGAALPVADAQLVPGGAGGDGVEAAAADLRALLPLEPADPQPAERARLEAGTPSAPIAEVEPTPLADLADALCAALRRPPGPEASEEVERLLDRLQAETLRAPLDIGDASQDAGVLAARLGLNGLHAFLQDQYDLAHGPFGSPAIFHALAQADEAGLGAYGGHVGQLVGSGRELLGLLELAAGAPDGPEARDRFERWALLLVQTLRGPRLHEALEALGDAGLLGALKGVMAGVLRQPRTRPDRVVLERVRDAGLDFEDLELAREAQRQETFWWGDDKNEWLALGDIEAYRGDYAAAATAFDTALRLDPGNDYGRRCTEALREGRFESFRNSGGFGSSDDRKRARRELRAAGREGVEGFAREARALDLGAGAAALARELAPGAPLDRPHDGVHIRRIGAAREDSRWGVLPALRGVEAIRGFFVSAAPVVEVRIRLGGRMLHRGAPASLPLEGPGERPGEPRRKSVFNAWVDVCDVPAGRYALELAFLDLDGGVQTHHEVVLVGPPRTEDEHPGSDAVVTPPPPGTVSIEAQIDARPSMVRAARRKLFDTPPRNVLVLRADQLGDMVCSAPALLRLRALLPQARLTGLVSPANADLARTLGLFDALIVVEFPVDPVERRRVMPLERQRRLQAELHAQAFDLAIDLADNSPSRHLLRLSGAPRLAGFDPGRYPFLDLGVDFHSRDPVNGSENVPATNKAVALVEALGAAMLDCGQTIRRPDLTPARLERFDVQEGGYIVLHAGARLAFSRWPHFPELASLLIARTDLTVVFISDDPGFTERLDSRLGGEPRFRLVEGALAFDELDALASYCAAFVGNDSGPKHLASLRGAQVVSLHCARNNWNEWGQENRGLILSRRVPCAGCQIGDHPEECGRDVACLRFITPDEVADAVQRLLAAGGPAAA